MDKAQPGAPDNTASLEINGTTYVIHEYMGAANSINELLAQRILLDMEKEKR